MRRAQEQVRQWTNNCVLQTNLCDTREVLRFLGIFHEIYKKR